MMFKTGVCDYAFKGFEMICSRTSTDGHLPNLSTTVFRPRRQSIILLLLKPSHNGHLSTTATVRKTRPELLK